MRMFLVVLLVAVTWLMGLVGRLFSFIPGFLRGIGGWRVRLLMHAFVMGTGWGGDDFVFEALIGIPDVDPILQSRVEAASTTGRPAFVEDMLLKMVRAVR